MLVAGADEKLRRAVTDRMLAQGKKLEGWPEIMTGICTKMKHWAWDERNCLVFLKWESYSKQTFVTETNIS